MKEIFKIDDYDNKKGYYSHIVLHKNNPKEYILVFGYYNAAKSVDELIKDVEELLNEVKKVNKEEKESEETHS